MLPLDDHRFADRLRSGIAGIEAADIALGVSLARAKDHLGVRALASASEVGSWQSLLALSVGTLAFGLASGDRRLAAAGRQMLVSGVLASVVKTSVKRVVHRTRPNVLMDTGRYQKGWLGPNVGPWQSFPSGHSALSVAVARAVGRAYPEVRTPVYATAAGIVAVQMLRGAHFPSDVVVGSLIGIAAEATADAICGSPRPADPRR
ncbi:phosphatase PAP2 family protein [Methylobacterium sp. Leaf466]|uniref:phosphatase PAP2 family protein n=1 Tax=Methylobacterium sp. Leaf466 TaxID=1736386 RepID=UPI0006F2CFD2|nr:phosphatase PAP2 family protein [Methylobacterium sp. Leaf466]KQT81850.1 phosphoesterase [Methylobacterium sp. Leaf466]